MSDDDELLRLLALERSHPDLPDGAEARILARVEASIAKIPGDGGDHDGGGDGPGRDVGGGNGGADTAGTMSAVSRAARTVMPWLARATYVTAGVVAGASGHAFLSPSRVAPSPHTVVATAPALSMANVHEVDASAGIAVGLEIHELAERSAGIGERRRDANAQTNVRSSAALAPSSVSTTRRDDGQLAEERADLDVARAALSRGRIDACLEALERHARTYGEGHFAEEREVLMMQALVAANRGPEARERARRFRAKYPTSLFGPAATQALSAEE